MCIRDRSGNGVGPILTALEPTWGHIWDELSVSACLCVLIISKCAHYSLASNNKLSQYPANIITSSMLITLISHYCFFPVQLLFHLCSPMVTHSVLLRLAYIWLTGVVCDGCATGLCVQRSATKPPTRLCCTSETVGTKPASPVKCH